MLDSAAPEAPGATSLARALVDPAAGGVTFVPRGDEARRPNWSPAAARRLGLVAGLAGVVVVGTVLNLLTDQLHSATPALALTVPVVVAGLFGGRAVAVLTAFVAAAVFDVAFLPPVGSLRVNLVADAVAMLAFTVVAFATGTVVAREADRRRSAVQLAAEWSEMHARLEATILERDQLEHETRRLAVLEEVDRQRAALLRAVSHDLRTPLGTIRAVSSDLQAGTNFDPETRKQLLELVVREAERLDRIVTNLLSLSRIEAGALAPERRPADLTDIARDAVTRLRPLFRDCELVLRIPTNLPPVLVDFTQIDLVLTNLLENAVRQAPPGSVVTLAAASDDAGHARVTVSDEGSGVDPALRDVLFEPFRSGRGGTGVGLAICRAVVEAHGGTIRLDEPERPGGRFVITLPFAP
jgi:two-component system sensor histidine kinase KdpD